MKLNHESTKIFYNNQQLGQKNMRNQKVEKME